MTLNKYLYILIMIFNISCQGQEGKNSNIEQKEMEKFNDILTKSNFKNSKSNFESTNKELLGYKSQNLDDGYNEIIIFNEPIDYQISKEGKFIKIGNDILPDIDKIKQEDLINYPYMKSVINLNKIIYQNDMTSILTIIHNDSDLALDIAILFNYEKNDQLLKRACDNIEDLEDYTNNFKLSIIFYNKDNSIRKKLLQYLSKKQELIYYITFYLADNRKTIVEKNKLSNKEIDTAIAFLLNIGLENRMDDDVYTGTDLSYRLLNNIFISYPSLIQSFEKDNYFDHKDLRYFTKVFKTEQQALNDNLNSTDYTIQDPDGYTNLRKEKNSSSEVLQKIKSGENIEVLDNSGDWWQVKTKEGKTGYVHKSRIKSGNNSGATSLLLYDRPDFSSFSKEIIANDDIEIVHQNLGWNFVKINGVSGYLPTEEKQKELQKEEKRKFSFLADEEEVKPENKKGFWDKLFG